MTGTLDSCYYKGQGEREGTEREFIMEHAERKHIVRRLTPLECCRLQGFPDWWESGLIDNNPTDEMMTFWRKVFSTCAEAFGKKQKTDKQIRKWLASEPADADRYKMWGNGIALPCAVDVLWRIKDFVENERGEQK